ncbi:MAG: DUF488 domain-containing protein [Proteobacteria bacterium]|nr:DUF488 domain-containing protein [Pseudomonadota bacterium]
MTGPKRPVTAARKGAAQGELALADPREDDLGPDAPLVLTIGHSTHPVDAFIGFLRSHGVGLLVDVRTRPGSKRNPQFNQPALATALAACGIAYRHEGELGGFRQPRLNSPNLGLRSAWLRGYADYMQTAAFADALGRLIGLAAGRRVAVMCAEALPENCHRSLVADALTANGVRVEHIVDGGPRRPHRLTAAARTNGTSVVYPGAAA